MNSPFQRCYENWIRYASVAVLLQIYHLPVRVYHWDTSSLRCSFECFFVTKAKLSWSEVLVNWNFFLPNLDLFFSRINTKDTPILSNWCQRRCKKKIIIQRKLTWKEKQKHFVSTNFFFAWGDRFALSVQCSWPNKIENARIISIWLL